MRKRENGFSCFKSNSEKEEKMCFDFLCLEVREYDGYIYCIKSTQIFQRRISLRCNESNVLLCLLRGKRWPRIFSRYLCFFWSHHSQCIFSVFSIRYFRYADST